MVTVRDLLAAGVHFGHQTQYWNPKMAPFIFAKRKGLHIINLQETLPRFVAAMNYVEKIANNGGSVLFVGTKGSASGVMKYYAEKCGMPYVTNRWLGGSLTNFKTIRESVRRFDRLEHKLADERFLKDITKKERLGLQEQYRKLEHNVGGVRHMTRLPDALFVVDVDHERNAIREANRLGIPVIGIVDTNCDPEGCYYMIPGNDDSRKAIQLYAETFSNVIAKGRSALDKKRSSNQRSKQQVVVKKVQKSESGDGKKIETKKVVTVAKKPAGKAAPKKPAAPKKNSSDKK